MEIRLTTTTFYFLRIFKKNALLTLMSCCKIFLFFFIMNVQIFYLLIEGKSNLLSSNRGEMFIKVRTSRVCAPSITVKNLVLCIEDLIKSTNNFVRVKLHLIIQQVHILFKQKHIFYVVLVLHGGEKTVEKKR